ncbi:type IV pilus biogenesis protein PilM [Paenibacillus allorhizosphaerae]|uniref:Pilus assembly protein PilM n=1 Tax=Paenibacillus allorhizosphaerae TaxID=2849866 RepID=A0ABM8VL93_9BACL|nr:pilus assembly protein PilM [Paenibacillus allorhizosphaerae]CAG7648269.1 hypothetical protein PAECIP111802_04166 [Paenibacillus allorhizosphaerae]
MVLEKLKFSVKELFHRSSSSLGIEITDQQIKMVELKKQSGNPPEISNWSAERLPAGTVVDGRIQDMPRVILTLQGMVAKNGWKRRKVHMVASGQAVMVRFLKLPDIPESELKKVVDFEVKHNIHLPFDEPYYDFCKLNGVHNRKRSLQRFAKQDNKRKMKSNDLTMKESAASKEIANAFSLAESDVVDSALKEQSHCDVMLVAAPRDLIDEYVTVAESSGLVPASVEIKALSLFRLIELTYSEGVKKPFLLVDVNESATDISIFHEGQLKITRSVSLGFGGGEAKRASEAVEDLLLLFPDRIEDDFHTSCNDLSHELERLINFYRYTLNNRDHEFHLIMLSGDAPKLSDISDHLEQRLGMQVNMLDYAAWVPEHNLQGETTSYSVPIGLALRER